MPYIDGLPVADAVDLDDLVDLGQGGTPGKPGTATLRSATVRQLFGGGGAFLPLQGGTLVGELIIDNPSGTSLDARRDVLVGGNLTVSGNVTLGAMGKLLMLVDIATDSTGLPSGTVYSNGGVLCIVP